MSRWVGLAAEWLRPIYQIILGGVLDGEYAQVDETVIKYLEPGSGRAQHGYFWTIKRPGGDSAFHWATTRAATVLAKIIPADFSGIIQCDGYGAYPAFAKRHGQPITLAACWAHARREFVEASQNRRAQGRCPAHRKAHWSSLRHRSTTQRQTGECEATHGDPRCREQTDH
jgi:transposase